jgi:HTH-type transcriptional regulator / antitoxin HipB
MSEFTSATDLLGDILKQAGLANPGVLPPTPHIVSTVEAIGKAVARRRKAKHLSQQAFSDLAGVGRRFVSELESGKPTAEIGKVLKVLNALGIDLMLRDR